MEFLDPIAAFALPATVLILLSLVFVRGRQRQARRRAPVRRDDLDTVAGWPPEPVRVLSVAERQAQELLKRAMPGYLVLAQVPLARFVRVPSKRSYGEWLQRVGSLSADLLLCDSGSRVLAVIDVRSADESDRSRRRHERMARVLRAARIQVHVWRDGELPSVSQVRAALSSLAAAPAATATVTTASAPARAAAAAALAAGAIPTGIAEILADGDRAALGGAFDASLEPVPSAFFDEYEPAA